MIGCLTLTGCGGARGDADADPASAMPPSSFVYVEAVVRPERGQRDAADALLERVAGRDDVIDLLIRAIDAGEGPLSYKDDIEPWLGDRIAVGVTGSMPQAGIVVAAAVRDREAAEAFLAKGTDSGPQTYRGVEYRFDDDTPAGLIGDLLVLGQTESAFKAAVDAAKGNALADDPEFDRKEGELPDERIGLLYGDPAEIAPQLNAIPEARPFVGLVEELSSAASAVIAREDALVLESGGPSKPGELTVFGLGGRTELLDEAPGNSATAFGQPALAEIGRAVLGALPGAEQTVSRTTGIDLERDLFSWLGDGMYFDQSPDPNDSRLAVVLEARDPREARAGIRRALAGLRDAGFPFRPLRVPGAGEAYVAGNPRAPDAFVVAIADDRVVLALGLQQAQDAVDPQDTLESTGALERARAALGGLEPAYVLDTTMLIDLVRLSLPEQQAALAQPYLDRLETFALGEDDDERRYVLKFR